MADVDWKKVNEEMQSSLIETENELLQEHSNLRTELQKFQQDHTAKSRTTKGLHTIVQERLCKKKQRKPNLKEKVSQTKKIVYI